MTYRKPLPGGSVGNLITQISPWLGLGNEGVPVDPISIE